MKKNMLMVATMFAIGFGGATAQAGTLVLGTGISSIEIAGSDLKAILTQALIEYRLGEGEEGFDIGIQGRLGSSTEANYTSTTGGTTTQIKSDVLVSDVFIKGLYTFKGYEVYGLVGQSSIDTNQSIYLTSGGITTSNIGTSNRKVTSFGVGFNKKIKSFNVGVEYIKYDQFTQAYGLMIMRRF